MGKGKILDGKIGRSSNNYVAHTHIYRHPHNRQKVVLRSYKGIAGWSITRERALRGGIGCLLCRGVPNLSLSENWALGQPQPSGLLLLASSPVMDVTVISLPPSEAGGS